MLPSVVSVSGSGSDPPSPPDSPDPVDDSHIKIHNGLSTSLNVSTVITLPDIAVIVP